MGSFALGGSDHGSTPIVLRCCRFSDLPDIDSDWEDFNTHVAKMQLIDAPLAGMLGTYLWCVELIGTAFAQVFVPRRS